VAGGVRPGVGNDAGPRSPLVSPLTLASGEPKSARGVAAHMPPVPEVPGAVEFVSPPTDTPSIDEDAYGALLWFRSLANLVGGVSPHNRADI
jgi:hypothetical protein